jgi:transglutaminase/protease-like cytokinesis protein 3
MTPPQLFLYDHLPEEPRWELVTTPISASEFVRRPILSPDAGRLGVTLEAPDRSQVSVDGELDLVLANPRHVNIMADVVKLHSNEDAKECVVQSGTDKVSIHCTFDPGESQVILFGGTATRLSDFGAVEVNSR